jgi:hypothetical protein
MKQPSSASVQLGILVALAKVRHAPPETSAPFGKRQPTWLVEVNHSNLVGFSFVP